MIVIMGIDPGTHYVGVSFITVDVKTLNIKNIEVFKIDTDIYVRNNPDINMYKRLMYISERLKEILEDRKPWVVAYETQFINPRTPSSVIPLSMLKGIIYKTVYDTNRINGFFDTGIRLTEYSPKEAKEKVGAGGLKEKEDVVNALLKIDEITKNVDISILTFDEVDAILLAYSQLVEYRKNPLKIIKG